MAVLPLRRPLPQPGYSNDVEQTGSRAELGGPSAFRTSVDGKRVLTASGESAALPPLPAPARAAVRHSRWHELGSDSLYGAGLACARAAWRMPSRFAPHVMTREIPTPMKVNVEVSSIKATSGVGIG